MIEGILGRRMNLDEERIKEELEGLFQKAENTKKSEDLEEFKLILDDYLDQGYKVKMYIFKYNLLIQKIYN
ncbi:MAG: hypothetical protein ACP5NZ_00035 [Nanobdellota archaeon]